MHTLKVKREISQTLTGMQEEAPVIAAAVRAHSEDGLKPAINKLLWQFLPSDLRLDECEALALGIFDIVSDPRAYLRYSS